MHKDSAINRCSCIPFRGIIKLAPYNWSSGTRIVNVSFWSCTKCGLWVLSPITILFNKVKQSADTLEYEDFLEKVNRV